MNRDELSKVFQRNKGPKRYCSFDGSGIGDCLALEMLDGRWTLSYYTDRGSRDQEATFDTETEGCEAMFDAMVSMVQGAQRRTITKNP